MESALAMLDQVSLAAVGGARTVSAEFPYLPHASSLLEIDAVQKQVDVGSGLLMTLHLPDRADRATLAEVAAIMNVWELEQYPFGHFRGAWCVSRRNAVAFKAFYPNVLGGRGLALNLALQMAGRAEWIATIMDERSREERWKTACPSFLRALEARH
jgi:hypothetical protein